MSGTLFFGSASSQKADARPISFMIDDQANGDTTDLLSFWIRPEDLTRSDPSRLTVQQTLGGAWADSWGPGVAQISISGTTGWRADLTGADGIARWLALRATCFDGWHARRAQAVKDGKDPDLVRLVFADALDDYAVIVAPHVCTLRRSKSRPLLISYQLAFAVVGDPADPSQSGDGLSSDDLLSLGINSLADTIDGLSKQLQSFTKKVNAFLSPIIKPIKAFMAATTRLYKSVLGLVNSATAPIRSVLGVVNLATQAAVNVFRTVAAVAAIPQVLKAQVMAIASSYSNIQCLFANALRGPRIYQNFDDLYGASNCSSTSGGRPASLYNLPGVNTFGVVAPVPAPPPVALTASAQTQLTRIANSDPVTSPMPLSQLGIALDQATPGIVVTG